MEQLILSLQNSKITDEQLPSSHFPVANSIPYVHPTQSKKIFHAQYQKDLEYIGSLFNFSFNREEDSMEIEEKVDEVNKRINFEELENEIQKKITIQLEKLFFSLSESGSSQAPFLLIKKSSSIQGAGDGIFLQGSVPSSGQVVSIYSGVSYLPLDILTVYSQVFVNNDYLISRFDGIILDGNTSGISQKVFESCAARAKVDKLTHGMCSSANLNSFAKAQFINHSSPQQINLFPIQYDFPLSFHSSLRPFIPCVPFQKNSQLLAQTLVMISTRPIQNGEELFFNYRYREDKSNLHPQWYKKKK